MFTPVKFKYKKAFKGRISQKVKGGYSLSFGDYGLKSLDYTRLTSKQIEAARRVISRSLSKFGKLWVCVFPNVPVSKKPSDVRMGKGKGAVEGWVFRISPGRVLFEIAGVDHDLAILALLKASYKLPIKTKVVSMEDYEI